MAKHKALVDCFVGNALRKVGDVFDYFGPENKNLENLEAEKPKAKPGPKPSVPKED